MDAGKSKTSGGFVFVIHAWIPSVPGLIGAVAVLLAGGIRPATLGLALVVAASGVAAAWWGGRRRSEAAASTGERGAGEQAPHLAEPAGNLDHLCAQVLPVWSGQIEMARVHAESSVNGLAAQLAELHKQTLWMASATGQMEVAARSLLDATAAMQAAELNGQAMSAIAAAQVVNEEAKAVAARISEALMVLQFQDRADQILSNVRKDQQRLERRLQSRDPGNGDASVRIDVAAWMASLAQTYTMLEQRALHDGGQAAAATEPGEIEFF